MAGPADNQRNAASVDEETRPEALNEATTEPEADPGEVTEPGDATEPGDVEEPVEDTEAAEAEPIEDLGTRDPDELAALVAQARRERDEYLDALQRERAEFENFRRRANRERMEALDRGAETLLVSLIGVLDDFDRVLDAAEQSEDSQLAKGIEMVHSALRGMLAEAGLEEVPGAGAPFDPNWHEAMMQVEADEPTEQPVVFEVLRKGYRFKGRVLRPASVSVAQ